VTNEDCPRFTPLTIAASDALASQGAPQAPAPAPAAAHLELAEITLVNGRRLSVAATIDPVVLVRLLQALDPR